MNDREPAVPAEARVLKLGGYAVRQTRQLAIAQVLSVPGRDRRGSGGGAAPMVDDLADRGSEGDKLRCGTQFYVGHIATMTGPVLFRWAHMQTDANYISLDPCVIPVCRSSFLPGNLRASGFRRERQAFEPRQAHGEGCRVDGPDAPHPALDRCRKHDRSGPTAGSGGLRIGCP